MPHPLNVVSSFLASGARLGGGLRRDAVGPRPETPPILYEFEACPYCRRAREAVTLLDLEVEIRPCPKKGPRFREEVRTRGGKAQFPFLIDPNTGTELYESTDIVRHLYAHYGAEGATPPWGLVGPLFMPGSIAASWVRPTQGTFYRGDVQKAPAASLILYGLEASPYTRIVRDALCELELPYLLRSTPTGSARWKELKARAGKAMVPYLIDPNTGTELYESADIRDYLYRTYGRA